MSLAITAVSPTNGATDVVLGIPIVVTFNGLIKTSTLSSASFSLTCPGGTQVITPGSLITRVPTTLSTNQYVVGAFTFVTMGTDPSQYTVATFVPNVPLNPNTTYTLLIVGSDSEFASGSAVTDPSNNPLASSYTWTFATGSLNVVTPPTSSPLNGPITTFIQTDLIVVSPLCPLTNQDIDVGYVMTITFPAPINTATFNVSEMIASIEPILNDPTITLSETLSVSCEINPTNGAQIIVTITD